MSLHGDLVWCCGLFFCFGLCNRYDTFSYAEEVDVVLNEGPSGVTFQASLVPGFGDGDTMEDDYPLRIRGFIRDQKGKKMQLEKTGLLVRAVAVVDAFFLFATFAWCVVGCPRR